MQILSVTLENAKSYDKATIEFTLGVNAIVGQNGAGKSTILEAIGFAVFDTLDYRQDEFIRNGTKSAQVTVTIASSLDERVYEVVRRIGSSNQHYIYDPELTLRICEGKVDVLDFLRKHLGVEPGTELAALFKDAVGVAQGTFTSAFLETPARRKPIFDSLLQVDEYQRAYERLREPISRLREQRNEISVEISALTARLERLPVLQNAVQERTEQIRQAEEDLDKARAELEEVQRRRKALEQTREQVMELRNHHQQAAQRVENVTAQLRDANEALLSAQQAREVLVPAAPVYDAYREAQAKQQVLERQARARQQILDQRSELEKQSAVCASETRDLQRMLTEVADAEKQVQELEPAVAQQKKLEEELLSAKQQLARREEVQKNLTQQHKQLSGLLERHTQLTAQLQEAARLEQQRAALEEQLPPIRTELDTCKASLVELKVEAESLKQQTEQLANADTALCPICEQELTDEHRTRLLDRNQARLEELRTQYSARQRTIREQQAQLETKSAEMEAVQKQARNMPRPAEVEQLDKEIGSRRSSITELEETVAKLDDASQLIGKTDSQLVELGNPRRHYDIAQETAKRRPKLEEGLAKAEAVSKQVEVSLAAVNQQLSEFAELDACLERVRTQMQKYVEGYQRYLANEQAASSYEARATAVEQRKEQLKAASTEQDRLSKKLHAAEQQYDENAYTSAVEREQNLRRVIGGLEAQSNMLADAQVRDKVEIETLQISQQTLQEKEALIARIDLHHDVLSQIRDLIRRAGPYITKALIRQISEGGSQTFSEIMQDHSRHLVWGEDYGITVEVDGHERQFAQLSGGEQMSAALAVRLALLREMSSIDVAFFDEPTTNLDETRREQLARQILQVKGFRQIFVISHDDTFEQATQNVIRVTRVDSTSRVEFV